MNKLTIVIPCFNEVESLPTLIKSISGLNKDINFLIVENGSRDNSREYLESMKQSVDTNINFLYLDQNKGYGNGVYQGLKHAKNSEFIGWVHGDLQFDFDKINKIFDKLNNLTQNKEIIFFKGVRKGRSLLEKFFSNSMGYIASLILKVNMYEINAQPTIFSSDLMKKINSPPNDFSFDTYVYWAAIKNNYIIQREEFYFPPRQFGFSNWNFGLKSRILFSNQLIRYFLELRKK